MLVVGGLVGTFRLLPVTELVSFFQFKIMPERAKVAHMARFKRGYQTITMVGTVHWDHFESNRYPIWELLSVIQTLKPPLVLVEIRPEAVDAGQIGEGPIEMPVCLLAARQEGIVVSGMDDWSNDMERREDRMAENILARGSSTRGALVFTGYSHIEGLGRRLAKAGFVREYWKMEDRRALLKQPVDARWPQGLRAAYEGSIARVEQGEDKHYDQDWARRRKAFVASLAKE